MLNEELSQLIEQEIPRLRRYARSLLRDRDSADDLVQDVCVRVLAKPRRLQGDDELAYLVRTLRNTFLTSRRAASRRPRADVDLEQVAAADPRADRRPERSAETREVFGAIAALPTDFRLALVAVDIAGLSYAEAADVLATREATIATRLFRAREQVARALREVPAPERSLR